MMTDINEFSLQQAKSAAAKLWAFGSAPFPVINGSMIQSHVEQMVIDASIAFAIHVRRLLDNCKIQTELPLNESFWVWQPVDKKEKIKCLRRALNGIVHATEFKVGFERLPDNSTKIDGGAICVLYLRIKTDKYKEALVDVFALSSCFFHRVLPAAKLPNRSNAA